MSLLLIFFNFCFLFLGGLTSPWWLRGVSDSSVSSIKVILELSDILCTLNVAYEYVDNIMICMLSLYVINNQTIFYWIEILPSV